MPLPRNEVRRVLGDVTSHAVFGNKIICGPGRLAADFSSVHVRSEPFGTSQRYGKLPAPPRTHVNDPIH
jgi:hypothetical protein